MNLEDFDLHDRPHAPPATFIPPQNLDELDLGQELADNLQAARSLRLEIQTDPDIPANQKAQVMNSVTTILTNLVKLQTDVYNAQRLKELEAILIKTMQAQPEPLKSLFFQEYEANLARTL